MNTYLSMRRLLKVFYAFQFKQSIKALLFYHVLAGSEHRQVLTNDFATIVDVGANRGQFSLAARRWSPRASVIAFEPLNKAATTFRKVFQRDANVTFHQVAIAPSTGKALIHLSAADDSSSLLPIAPLQEKLFPGTNEIGTEKIDTGPLSNYVSSKRLKPPALLKLDVQGYELQALIGCQNLFKHFTLIYVECSFFELYSGQKFASDIIQWLRERDFILKGLYNMFYDRNGNSVQADFLFQNMNQQALH